MTGIELIKLLREALIPECPRCQYDLTKYIAWDILEARLSLIEEVLEKVERSKYFQFACPCGYKTLIYHSAVGAHNDMRRHLERTKKWSTIHSRTL